MASKKPTMILMSKTDMGEDEIKQLTDEEAWKLIYSFRSKKAKDNRLEVCFTGFGPRKESMKEFAASKNFKPVGSVTKKLDFLVCGDKQPGPVKTLKAESQGVQIMNEHQFMQLCETGEVPKLT